MDLVSALDAVHRDVVVDEIEGDTVRVLLRRGYPTTPEELWSALIEPDRVVRWSLPLHAWSSLRLAAEGEDTVLELEPSVPVAMAGSAAGALFVGPGWDGALRGLGLFVRGEAVGDPVAAAGSPE